MRHEGNPLGRWLLFSDGEQKPLNRCWDVVRVAFGLALLVLLTLPGLASVTTLDGEKFEWVGNRNFNGNFGCNSLATNDFHYEVLQGDAFGPPFDARFREDGIVTVIGGQVTDWKSHFSIRDFVTDALLVDGHATSLVSGGPGECHYSGINLTAQGGSALATMHYEATIYDPVSGSVSNFVSGTTSVKLSYSLVNDDVRGSQFKEFFGDQVTLSGLVQQSGPEVNTPLPGAVVQLCQLPLGPCSPPQTTGPDATFSFSGLVPLRTYRVQADPPAGAAVLPGSRDVEMFGDVKKNVSLNPPIIPPPGTTITKRGTNPDGLPIVYWRDLLTLVTTGCAGASVSYSVYFPVERADGPTGPMTEGPVGTYTANFGPLEPHKGYARVDIIFTCPGTPPATVFVSFDIYVDPSGVVRTPSGDPIAGATVTLLRSESADGPFSSVADGSAVMSLENRHDPDTTDARGLFGWDVLPGYYRIRAEKAGCQSPTDPQQTFVLSQVLAVPPAIADLDLRLACGVRDTTAPITMAVASPSPNAHGWNVSDVAVAFHATDEPDGSGVNDIHYTLGDGITSATQIVAGDTALVPITREGMSTLDYFATDKAGNAEAAHHLLIQIDKTPPSVNGTRVTAANANGWNNGPVEIHFQAIDAGSGIDGLAAFNTTLNAEGVNQSLSYTFLDLAGNAGSATVSGINIDLTSPTIAITSPSNGAIYQLNQKVPSSYTCSDNLSGVAACSGPRATGSDLDTTSVGTKIFTVNAADIAGNAASAFATYQVVCHYVSIIPNPSTVTQGGITTITVKLMSCTGSAQTIAIKFALTGPLQPGRCSRTRTEMFSTGSFLLPANTLRTISFPFRVPSETCSGTYSVTATTLLNGQAIDTSSSSLVVTLH